MCSSILAKRLKCTKFAFGYGAPDPAGELTIFPEAPIAGFAGAYFLGEGWKGGEGDGSGKPL